MKKLLSFVLTGLSVIAYAGGKVPISVHIPENGSNIPAGTRELIVNRIKSAAANSGMGATDDVRQFYITAKSTCLDKHIITGSPIKYFHTSELTFYVVDAFSQKEFSSMSIECKGVGNSEEQAYSNSLKEFKPTDAKMNNYLSESASRILKYYNEQYNAIIAQADALALVHRYEEALFFLSCIPEECEGYTVALEDAVGIYRKYIDNRSYKALMKAQTIWNSGQDKKAAAEAGEYIAQVDPNSKYYKDAVSLNKEINTRIKSDIEYYRKLESRDATYLHQETMSFIDAWRQVGVAYGNGQKSVYYKTLW